MIAAQLNARTIKARLWSPTNAVLDRGIDLRRQPEPAPVAAVEPDKPFWWPPHVYELQAVTVDRVMRVVCERFQISREHLIGRDKHNVVVIPRHIAIYLAKTRTRLSYPQLGQRFGGRDHTTCMHAVHKITWLRAKDADLDNKIMGLEDRL